MLIVQFGLRHKKSGDLLKASIEATCENTVTSLCRCGEQLWTVDSEYQAEYVRNMSTEWYNASHDTPSHDFEADDLEVVKIETLISDKQHAVSVPTKEAYFEIKYKKDDPKHYDYCMEQNFDGLGYTWYDLSILITEKKWPPSEVPVE